MTDDVLLFMQSMELKKVNLLAYSLGGFIGQLLLKTNPELINKIVLVGTGSKSGSHMSQTILSQF